MTPQHITLALGTASFVSALAMFYWCEFGKGGNRALSKELTAERDDNEKLREELEAEVELNVKLLRTHDDITRERDRYSEMLTEHNKICSDFTAERFAKNIENLGNKFAKALKDLDVSQFLSAGAGKGERTSVEQSSARPSSRISDEISAAVEVENGASAESGPDGARIILPDDWRNKTCDEIGHRFENGAGHCLRCTAKQASVDDIEQIRSAAS